MRLQPRQREEGAVCPFQGVQQPQGEGRLRWEGDGEGERGRGWGGEGVRAERKQNLGDLGGGLRAEQASGF